MDIKRLLSNPKAWVVIIIIAGALRLDFIVDFATQRALDLYLVPVYITGAIFAVAAWVFTYLPAPIASIIVLTLFFFVATGVGRRVLTWLGHQLIKQ